MPEQRGRKYHQERVAETLRDEIGAMIEGELSDPRISFAYISQVVLNSRRKKIGAESMWSSMACTGRSRYPGRPDAARGYIRYQLLERMGKRFVPDRPSISIAPKR